MFWRDDARATHAEYETTYLGTLSRTARRSRCSWSPEGTKDGNRPVLHRLRRLQHQPDAGVRSLELCPARTGWHLRGGNPRGGGEYGEACTKPGCSAGSRTCSTILWRRRVARVERLESVRIAIEGGSRRALTAAVMVQRPDPSWRRCSPRQSPTCCVPPLTVGRFWISEMVRPTTCRSFRPLQILSSQRRTDRPIH